MHTDDNAYDSLAEAPGGDDRWAYGTGFTDPLAGVDTTVPEGVDAAALGRDCLALGDDALVMAQRLAAWCSNAPELEDEMALANIALDLLGQARLLLTRAAAADPSLRPPSAPEHSPDEDALAYFRDERDWHNVRLAELDDHLDFAECIARLFLFATWRLAVMTRRRGSPDPVLAAIATKAVTEITYHREYAAGWMLRLGDGTETSHTRLQEAIDRVWPYVDELFTAERDDGVREEFDAVVGQVLAAATLQRPDAPPRSGVAGLLGRDGVHTEQLGYLLAEMQSVARAHPKGKW